MVLLYLTICQDYQALSYCINLPFSLNLTFSPQPDVLSLCETCTSRRKMACREISIFDSLWLYISTYSHEMRMLRHTEHYFQNKFDHQFSEKAEN